MKRYLYALLITLALVFSCVPTAHAAVGYSLTLESIVLIPSKGVVFTFIPQGNFEPADLTGFARINGDTFPLACQVNDMDKVKCVGERGLSRFVGQVVTGQVAGFAFSGKVRPAGGLYCYAIFEKIAGEWEQVGSSCGSARAKKGDWILFKGVVAVFSPKGPAGAGFYLE